MFKKVFIIIIIILIILSLWWFLKPDTLQENSFTSDWKTYETEEVSMLVPQVSFDNKCDSENADVFNICYLTNRGVIKNIGNFAVYEYGAAAETSCGRDYQECTFLEEKNMIKELKVGSGATAQLYTGLVPDSDEEDVKLLAWENKDKTKVYILLQTTLSGAVDEIFDAIRDSIKFR